MTSNGVNRLLNTLTQLFWREYLRLNAKAHEQVIVIATAKPGQPFNANTLHNLVVEPMVEESDAIVLEEQVEE